MDFLQTRNNNDNNQRVVGFEGNKWEVHKFGGTSVASAECFIRAAVIVEEQLGIAENDDSLTSGHNELNLAVVVSAMGGKPKVTDLLLSTVSAAAKRDSEKVQNAVEQVLEKHRTCIHALFPDNEEERQRLHNVIEADMTDVRDILKTVSVMKWQATRISELVSGYGELWSSQILLALLSDRAQKRTNLLKEQDSSSTLHQDDYKHHAFVYLDARRVITIDEEAIQNGSVCWELSQDKLKQVHDEELARVQQEYKEGEFLLHYAVTGYVACNTDGVATTLQRDGSDYSAAIMGRLLQSNNVTIWTDVDGVLSADPRRVPSAHVIPEVSYNEAMELAYFGAKVIHPKTMQPAISALPRQIPIYIRNTFRSAFPGTRIYTSSTTHKDRDKCVCGFSSVENMALINVEGSGLVGVPGVARRMFATLENVGVNIVLISQASSEHSITFATNEWQAEMAKAAIEEEFRKELKANRISNVDVQSPCSIIAAVGDGMSHTSGVSGRFFSALGDAKINILAISQGCSERNISAVVMMKDSTRALRAVHAAFRLSHTMVRVGVVGMGELGISLVKLLEAQRDMMCTAFDIDLHVCAIVKDAKSPDVVKLKYDGDGVSDSISVEAFDQVTGGSMLLGAPAASVDDGNNDVATVAPGGFSSLLEYIFNDECAHHVIFDCTNDEEVGKLHAEWLREGVHVVTANNTGLSGPKEQRLAISAAEIMYGKLSAQYLREVTVGGGLPVVSTLKSLLNSGDKIRRVDGILSVSLSFIMFRISPPPEVSKCSDFDEESSRGAFRGDLSMSPKGNVGQACSFSEAVNEAIALGLTEEHPVHDLSNEYTARVLMVLAKELGLDQYYDTMEIIDASDKLIDSDDDYKSFTAELDQRIRDRVVAAEKKGCVLRHISSVDVKSKLVEIKITEVPNNHVFAVTPPSCECVRFFTQRHRRYPLIIQGPSAGADSTASALLAELLSLMRSKVGPRSGALSRTGSSAYLTSN